MRWWSICAHCGGQPDLLLAGVGMLLVSMAMVLLVIGMSLSVPRVAAPSSEERSLLMLGVLLGLPPLDAEGHSVVPPVSLVPLYSGVTETGLLLDVCRGSRVLCCMCRLQNRSISVQPSSSELA